MQSSDIPGLKFAIPWANAAGGTYVRNIPQASQIGVNDGFASLTDGFPPLNATPIGAGGVPPFIQDFNGILKEMTAWSRWQQAGGTLPFDATFSAAIGGYPKGATLVNTARTGFWISTAENNTTDPDAGGANWLAFGGNVGLFNNQVLFNNTRTTLSGSGAGVFVTAFSGSFTKKSATSKLLVQAYVPDWVGGVAGPGNIKLAVGAQSVNALASTSSPAAAGGAAPVIALLSGLAAGALAWAIGFGRGDATAWACTVNPSPTDDSFIVAQTSSTIMFGEIEP